MKKILWVLCSILFITTIAISQEISLFIKGGAGFIGSGGDMKAYFDSTLERLKNTGHKGKLGYEYNDRINEAALSGNLLIFKNLGLRIEGNYIFKKWDNDLDLIYHFGWEGTLKSQEDYILKTFSLGLRPYFSFGKRIKINIGIGPDLYFFKFEYNVNSFYSEPDRIGQKNWQWVRDKNFKSSFQPFLGLTGYVEFEFPIYKSFSFVLDTSYKYVEFKKIKGKYMYRDKMSWEGNPGTENVMERDNYFVWFSTSNVWGNIYHYMNFGSSPPTTSDISRFFKFSFSGFYLKLGVKIRLI